MHYVAICLDKPNSNEVRLANRTAHLDYLRSNSKTIKSCGPFLSDDGLAMVGSMLIIEADDRAVVETVLAQDPYRKAGLFASPNKPRARQQIRRRKNKSRDDRRLGFRNRGQLFDLRHQTILVDSEIHQRRPFFGGFFAVLLCGAGAGSSDGRAGPSGWRFQSL